MIALPTPARLVKKAGKGRPNGTEEKVPSGSIRTIASLHRARPPNARSATAYVMNMRCSVEVLFCNWNGLIDLLDRLTRGTAVVIKRCSETDVDLVGRVP